jgi:riboflavin kinase/FMN adenylyltransferase
MNNKSIYALGFFDGVHLGHQALLHACCRLARELNKTPCAITFERHPMSLFTDNPPPLMRYMKKLLAENKITEKVYNKLARENAIRILGL